MDGAPSLELGVGSVVDGMVGGRIVGSVLVARGKGEVKLGGAARVGVGGGCTQHHTYVIHHMVTDEEGDSKDDGPNGRARSRTVTGMPIDHRATCPSIDARTPRRRARPDPCRLWRLTLL